WYRGCPEGMSSARCSAVTPRRSAAALLIARALCTSPSVRICRDGAMNSCHFGISITILLEKRGTGGRRIVRCRRQGRVRRRCARAVRFQYGGRTPIVLQDRPLGSGSIRGWGSEDAWCHGLLLQRGRVAMQTEFASPPRENPRPAPPLE